MLQVVARGHALFRYLWHPEFGSDSIEDERESRTFRVSSIRFALEPGASDRGLGLREKLGSHFGLLMRIDFREINFGGLAPASLSRPQTHACSRSI